MNNAKRKKSLTYKDAGVDISTGNELVKNIASIVKATNRDGVMGSIGGFGGLFDISKYNKYENPVLVSANDGVGTKLKIAFAMNKHDTVGIDLVAMSVNDLIVQGAEPLFFLDYFACGRLDNHIAEDVIKGIGQGCIDAGCALIGGETAEMPDMYSKGEYDLAGFAVGIIEKRRLLPSDNIKEGDVLIALPSNGVHSNAFSLIRKVVDVNNISYNDKAEFDDEGKTYGDAFLTPTKIYAKAILKCLNETKGIKALAHITGGGLIENIPRMLPNGLNASINGSSVILPQVFSWLKQMGNIEYNEMLRAFNCGVGMIILTEDEKAGSIIDNLSGQGENAYIIGKTIKNTDDIDAEPMVEFASPINF